MEWMPDARKLGKVACTPRIRGSRVGWLENVLLGVLMAHHEDGARRCIVLKGLAKVKP